MRLLLTTGILVIFLVAFSDSRSDGAPEKACTSLEPEHGASKPKASLSPYAVKVSKVLVVKGEKLQVMITSSPEGVNFHGFMMQARAPGTTTPLGTFTEFPSEAQTLNCQDGNQNTVSHTNAYQKKSMKFEWQAPSDYEGDIIFNATVVQNFGTYWTGVISDIVKVADHSGDNSSHSVGISTTKSPKTTTTPEPYTTEKVVKATVRADPVYDGCGETKACFGSSPDCVEMQDCPAFVSILVKGSYYEFEMKGTDVQYVAVGLSDDKFMGDDSVIECANDGSGSKGVNAYMSWNPGKFNQRLSDNITNNAIELLTGTAADGTLHCKVSRSEVTEIMGRTYDLANNKYFLLLAAGNLKGDKSLAFHDVYVASAESNYLSDVSGFTAASKLLIRLHGAFMVTAWIGSASLGILLARYFRQTWVGTQFCGKDLWFAWHRMFMVLTWSLTVVAFILIFVDRQDWSDGPHAILGVITTFLAFIQPFGAALRPHPDSRKRPIFNWLHWLVGNVAHILAIVTIFFAGKLTNAELPAWLIWILVAYVAFHVCMHLILSIAGCISERQSGKRVNSFPMKDITNSRMPLQSAERKQDAPHSCFRKLMLAVYIVGILAITVAIIVIIVLAPIEEEWERLTSRASGN
ncbi:putative ferric-chelate reductase 1 homolog [Anabrus simplex]|uniref:putative ferric-chelate reductase 1 homolog n=1 Tax=Anabrus simplex TaxID=316456 RepID=UPI0034DCE375